MNTKPVQVVMLPQVKNNTIFPAIAQVHCLNNKLELCEDGLLRTPCTYNHLYFISVEKQQVKVGDWIYRNGMIFEASIADADEFDYCVIASTNPALGLPAIPLTWIRDVYVPSNGSIKEVRLMVICEAFSPNCCLKITSNNEVVIVDEPIILGENGKRIVQHIKDKQKECQQKLDAKITEAKEWAEKVNQTLNWSDKESVDQELEDAAKAEYLKRFPYPTSDDSKQELECLSKQSGFKQGAVFGANWKAEQSANDAMEFAEWTHKNLWAPINDEGLWYNKNKVYQYKTECLTTKKLYELWQQNKKKRVL